MKKGQKHSKESKRKISINSSNPSEETRRKLSKSHQGKNNGMYGKHHSEETKRKISENKERAKKISEALTGRIMNKKWRRKLQKNHADVSGCKNSMYGKIAAKNAGYGHGSYYESPLQGKIWLKSSYELAYAKYLDANKILWYYEIETFELSDEITYTPDFFLIKNDKFIEIKGYMKKESQEKINKFKEEYPFDLEILYKEDLIKLGCNIK